MATSTRMEYIQREFNDHPSLASLDDYEPSLRNSPNIDLPSQHSGFRSGVYGPPSDVTSDSESPWSPPAWRRPASGWFQPVDRLAQAQRRGSAWDGHIKEEDDEDLSIPANVPLPASPEKTPNPDEDIKHEEEEEDTKEGSIPLHKSEDLSRTVTIDEPSHKGHSNCRFRVDYRICILIDRNRYTFLSSGRRTTPNGAYRGYGHILPMPI